MTARPSRLLTVVAVVLVALLGAEPGAATADSLGGVVPRGTTFVLARPAGPPLVRMADNFTTAGALDARVPESHGTATWTQVRGKWAVRNGYLDPPQLPGALVLYPTADTDLTVEMSVTIAGPYHFGPVLRANPAGTSFLVVRMSSTNTLAVGAHAVTAAYGGDADHLASLSGAVSHTVLAAPSTTAVDSTVSCMHFSPTQVPVKRDIAQP